MAMWGFFEDLWAIFYQCVSFFGANTTQTWGKSVKNQFFYHFCLGVVLQRSAIRGSHVGVEAPCIEQCICGVKLEGHKNYLL